jgi:excinuclease ABC subunit A
VVRKSTWRTIGAVDWILDLGPEGGDGGGELVASGRPEDIAAGPRSYTGQFLTDLLDRQPKGKREAAE